MPEHICHLGEGDFLPSGTSLPVQLIIVVSVRKICACSANNNNNYPIIIFVQLELGGDYRQVGWGG